MPLIMIGVYMIGLVSDIATAWLYPRFPSGLH